jgi:hypothetical protein
LKFAAAAVLAERLGGVILAGAAEGFLNRSLWRSRLRNARVLEVSHAAC